MKSSIINKSLCLMSMFVFCSLPLFAGGGDRVVRTLIKGASLNSPEFASMIQRAGAGRAMASDLLGRQAAGIPGAVMPPINLSRPPFRQVELDVKHVKSSVEPNQKILQTSRTLHMNMVRTGIKPMGGVSHAEPFMSVGIGRTTPDWLRARIGEDGQVHFGPVSPQALGGMPGAVERRIAQVTLSPEEELLKEAAAKGDLEGLKALFERGVRVMPRQEENFYSFIKVGDCLFEAAMPHPEVVKYLLTVQDPVLQEYITYGRSLPYIAVRGGYKESFLILIDRSDTEFFMDTYLQMALGFHQLEMAKFIMDTFKISPARELEFYRNMDTPLTPQDRETFEFLQQYQLEHP